MALPSLCVRLTTLLLDSLVASVTSVLRATLCYAEALCASAVIPFEVGREISCDLAVVHASFHVNC